MFIFLFFLSAVLNQSNYTWVHHHTLHTSVCVLLLTGYQHHCWMTINGSRFAFIHKPSICWFCQVEQKPFNWPSGVHGLKNYDWSGSEPQFVMSLIQVRMYDICCLKTQNYYLASFHHETKHVMLWQNLKMFVGFHWYAHSVGSSWQKRPHHLVKIWLHRHTYTSHIGGSRHTVNTRIQSDP